MTTMSDPMSDDHMCDDCAPIRRLSTSSAASTSSRASRPRRPSLVARARRSLSRTFGEQRDGELRSPNRECACPTPPQEDAEDAEGSEPPAPPHAPRDDHDHDRADHHDHAHNHSHDHHDRDHTLPPPPERDSLYSSTTRTLTASPPPCEKWRVTPEPHANAPPANGADGAHKLERERERELEPQQPQQLDPGLVEEGRIPALDRRRSTWSARDWDEWAREDVATMALVPALVIQALSAGILDATTYADFSTFASNQTGNAILLTLTAVGTVAKASVLLLLTGVSFAGFIGFAFAFGHMGHWFGVRRRAWLLFSTLAQVAMLTLSAILLSPAGPASTSLGAKHDWVIIFLFAGMSGAQVVMARQSSCQELPTAPMTSAFVDFVADHYLFAAWGNPKAGPRNRRIYYVGAMIGGSFLGAAMHRYSASWVMVVVATGLKAAVAVMIGLARGEHKVDVKKQ